jgi:hypothetical protein
MLGLSYQTVVKHALNHGIEFNRKMGTGGRSSNRNNAICDRYLNGEKQADLAREFGITRERVRQLIERAGLVSETKRHDDYVAVVAGTVFRKRFTLLEASEYFGTSKMNVYNYCRKHGVTPMSRTAAEDAELSALADEVKAGKSIRQAAGYEHAKAERLRRHLIKNGIEARGRSRHDDFSHRKELIERWRAEGRTWSSCAELLSKHDGREITPQGVIAWAYNHLRHLFGSRERVAA